jgi:tetratricopeptide (TPR) repeat protein
MGDNNVQTALDLSRRTHARCHRSGRRPGRPTTSRRGIERSPAERSPILRQTLIHRGLCLYAAGKWLEAARAWERYLKVVTAGADAGSVNSLIENAYNREGPDWLVYRGLALFEEGNYGGAERVWLRWLEIAPEDAKQYSVRVWILDARERQRVA